MFGAGTLSSVIPARHYPDFVPFIFSRSEYDAICEDWYVIGGQIQGAFCKALVEHGYEEQAAREIVTTASVDSR